MTPPNGESAEVRAWDTHDTQHDKIGTHTYGFWIYLLNDAMIYAALFATDIVLSHRMNAAGAPMGRSVVHPLTAFWETVILLSGGVAYGLVLAGQKRAHARLAILGLALASLAGGGFVYLSLHSFLKLAARGITPERSGYLSIVFVLVLYHTLHIGLGVVWMIVMIAQILIFGFHPNVVYRLLNLRLFWLFQIVIWILIYTFVYLAAPL